MLTNTAAAAAAAVADAAVIIVVVLVAAVIDEPSLASHGVNEGPVRPRGSDELKWQRGASTLAAVGALVLVYAIPSKVTF